MLLMILLAALTVTSFNFVRKRMNAAQLEKRSSSYFLSLLSSDLRSSCSYSFTDGFARMKSRKLFSNIGTYTLIVLVYIVLRLYTK